MADARGIGKDDSDVGCHRNERNREMESSVMCMTTPARLTRGQEWKARLREYLPDRP
jgi:hypothetical protein